MGFLHVAHVHEVLEKGGNDMRKIALITGKQFNENYNDIVGIEKVKENEIIVLTYDVIGTPSAFKRHNSDKSTIIKGLAAVSLTKEMGINTEAVNPNENSNEDLEIVLNELRTVGLRHLNNRKDELRV